MTSDFARAAQEARPEALITEGTRVSTGDRKREMGEAEVAKETARLLEANPHLVFSSFRGNDVDRVLSFYEACQATGRRLVVSMKVALLLGGAKGRQEAQGPRVGRDVSVYLRRKGKGGYDDRDYYKWERRFLDHGFTAEDVKKQEGKVLLHLDRWYLPELIDIRPERGGVYIHADHGGVQRGGRAGREDHQELGRPLRVRLPSDPRLGPRAHGEGGGPREPDRREEGHPDPHRRPDLFRRLVKKGEVVMPRKGKAMSL